MNFNNLNFKTKISTEKSNILKEKEEVNRKNEYNLENYMEQNKKFMLLFL